MAHQLRLFSPGQPTGSARSTNPTSASSVTDATTTIRDSGLAHSTAATDASAGHASA
jgi:hypothetical protein